mmetsp:Transcript_22898/g.63275  ORF Transcript_22898/g.63275 Transcript_22898/m.63275 type:complete len:230 (+) Transcript_22898:1843-2532(+)
MARCTPVFKSRSCGPLGTPPDRHVLRMPAARPNLSASLLICTASSRVGASTSSWGPWRKSLWPAFLMCIMPGSKKPHVLPLPVLLTATMSRPPKSTGQAEAWMGVGDVKPACVNLPMMSAGKPASVKLCRGTTASAPGGVSTLTLWVENHALPESPTELPEWAANPAVSPPPQASSPFFAFLDFFFSLPSFSCCSLPPSSCRFFAFFGTSPALPFEQNGTPASSAPAAT